MKKRHQPLRQFLIMWSILFGITLIEAEFKADRLSLFAIVLASMAATVVLHYSLLFDRYAKRGKYSKYLLLLLPFIAGAILLDITTSVLITKLGYWGDLHTGLNILVQVSITRVLVADMPIAYVYAAVHHFYKSKRRQEELEAEKSRNDLLLLRSKIEPAFVNTILTALQQTAQREQASQTASYLSELGSLFAYSAKEARKEVIPVASELDFINRYIALQKIRIAANEQIVIDAATDADNSTAQIAPMLLLSFVENAFKYGVSYEQPSRISVSTKLQDGVLLLNVENTDHTAKSMTASTGTGLANVMKRLELQYKDKYTLEQKNDNGIYAVSLRLQLN